MLTLLITKILDYLSNKPVAGFITWVSTWVFGSVPVATITLRQENILWILQIVSLLIGCIAGIFTIISIIRKKK